MKKYVSFLMLASLMLFFSCRPTRDSNGRRLVSRIDIDYSDDGLALYRCMLKNYVQKENYIEFSYDGQGRLTSASHVVHSTYDNDEMRRSIYEGSHEELIVRNYEITVTGNNLYWREEEVRGVEGDKTSTYLRRYELNEDGFIVKDDAAGYEYDYDENGQLSSCSKDHRVEIQYGWVDGNLISTPLTRKWKMGYEFAYSTRVNLCNMDLGVFSSLFLNAGDTWLQKTFLGVRGIDDGGLNGLLAMFGYYGVLNNNVLDETEFSGVYEFSEEGLIRRIEIYLPDIEYIPGEDPETGRRRFSPRFNDRWELNRTLTFSYK